MNPRGPNPQGPNPKGFEQVTRSFYREATAVIEQCPDRQLLLAIRWAAFFGQHRCELIHQTVQKRLQELDTLTP